MNKMKKTKTIIANPKKLTVEAPTKNPITLHYENDFYKWAMNQASLLQKGQFNKLDVDHLIEEIKSLGRSERDKLESFLTVLLMHMLKIKYQSGKHTRSWDLSIKNSKHKAKKVLKENPSLKPKLQEIIKEAYFSARLEAAIETGLAEKIFPKECPWEIKDIL